MSDIAILTAVPETLRANLPDWTSDNCKAMPDGRPDPVMGNMFCAVHITERQTVIHVDHGVHRELWGIGITVTKRIEAVPYDRVNTSIYLTHVSGISPVMNRIIYEIHNRWKVVNSINAAIPDDGMLNVTAQSFISPLLLLNRNPKLTFEDEPWFHGTHGGLSRDAQDGHVGVSMTAYFGTMIKETILNTETCT
jgi:hypothetical protein